ncbi:MAG: BrnT family toxin [Thermomicrobiales bacterium]
MRFEWDIRKSRSNLTKHGITFELAEIIFFDPLSRTMPDREVNGEKRWITLGTLPNGRVLFVAHTLTGSDEEPVVRIISARKATIHERREFEEDS